MTELFDDGVTYIDGIKPKLHAESRESTYLNKINSDQDGVSKFTLRRHP